MKLGKKSLLTSFFEATYGEDSNLDEVWKKIHLWLSQNNQYEYGEHQWLEEHKTIEGEGGFHSMKVNLRRTIFTLFCVRIVLFLLNQQIRVKFKRKDGTILCLKEMFLEGEISGC